MRTAIASISTALIGIVFVIWFNLEIVELFQSEILKNQDKTISSLTVFPSGRWNKHIAIGIALVGILLGIKSLRDKKLLGVIGIILSLLLIALTFLPLWVYFLSDTALDIGVHN
ncbi:MAG: hypothetical protein AAGL34_17915 [Bacteroidota bacterium]